MSMFAKLQQPAASAPFDPRQSAFLRDIGYAQPVGPAEPVYTAEGDVLGTGTLAAAPPRYGAEHYEGWFKHLDEAAKPYGASVLQGGTITPSGPMSATSGNHLPLIPGVNVTYNPDHGVIANFQGMDKKYGGESILAPAGPEGQALYDALVKRQEAGNVIWMPGEEAAKAPTTEGKKKGGFTAFMDKNGSTIIGGLVGLVTMNPYLGMLAGGLSGASITATEEGGAGDYFKNIASGVAAGYGGGKLSSSLMTSAGTAGEAGTVGSIPDPTGAVSSGGTASSATGATSAVGSTLPEVPSLASQVGNWTPLQTPAYEGLTSVGGTTSGLTTAGAIKAATGVGAGVSALNYTPGASSGNPDLAGMGSLGDDVASWTPPEGGSPGFLDSLTPEKAKDLWDLVKSKGAEGVAGLKNLLAGGDGDLWQMLGTTAGIAAMGAGTKGAVESMADLERLSREPVDFMSIANQNPGPATRSFDEFYGAAAPGQAPGLWDQVTKYTTDTLGREGAYSPELMARLRDAVRAETERNFNANTPRGTIGSSVLARNRADVMGKRLLDLDLSDANQGLSQRQNAANLALSATGQKFNDSMKQASLEDSRYWKPREFGYGVASNARADQAAALSGKTKFWSDLVNAGATMAGGMKR